MLHTIATVRRPLTSLIDLLYPPRCCGCNDTTPTDGLCSTCIGQLRPVHPPQCQMCGLPFASRADTSRPCGHCLTRVPAYRRAQACLVYDAQDSSNPLATVIQSLKYDRDISLAPLLSGLLLRYLPILAPFDLILPVPLHRERLRWRGFNQAVLLARRLSRHSRKPLALRALIRHVATKPQVELGEAERRQNVRGAFEVRDRGVVHQRRVLLIDDVLTTGATVDECARTLRRAGASQVDVLTLARAVAS